MATFYSDVFNVFSDWINQLIIVSGVSQAGGAVHVEGSDLTGTASAVVDVKTLFKLSRDTSVFKNTTDKVSREVGTS